jgi:hypothetical protein
MECNSALDAALALSHQHGLGWKPGLVFPLHSLDSELLCREERELIARTNWTTGFFDAHSCNALLGTHGVIDGNSSTVAKGVSSRAAPGAPECIIAEDILVLRGSAAEATCAELAAAIAFAPERQPRLADDRYARREDRLGYKRQVEAVLKACCLLNLDSVCVGCADGVAGCSLFGHPLGEAAEVWREALHEPVLAGVPMAAHFKRIVFAVRTGVPFSAVRTAAVLRGVFADSLAAT